MLQGAGGGIRGCWAITVLCAVLTLSATASAPASASERRGSNTYVAFEAGPFSTGGYDVRLQADRFSAGDSGLTISVRRGDREQGHGDRVNTFYTPASGARIDASRIRSRLGRRGSVGMRFRPRTRRVTRSGCDRKIVERGVLTGHLRFRGEAGYLKLLEHRIEARRLRLQYVGCSASASGGQPRPKSVLLAACRRHALFGARRMPRGRTDFVALGGFGLSRGLYRGTVAILEGNEGQFEYAPDLSGAFVDPPRPFRGTGVYLGDGDGAGRFEGNLRASFFATRRIPFAPATGKLVRRNSVGCDTTVDLPREADARSDALRLLGAGWLAGAGGA